MNSHIQILPELWPVRTLESKQRCSRNAYILKYLFIKLMIQVNSLLPQDYVICPQPLERNIAICDNMDGS